MSYDIGTQIDLTHLNKKQVVKEKKSSSETRRTLYEVGSQFVFQFKENRQVLALKIPITFA